LRGERKVNLLLINGFATDGVTTIEFHDASNIVRASTAVSGNVFSVSVPGVPISGGHLVAKDSQGNTVYTEAY
jgi:hypothetical protein